MKREEPWWQKKLWKRSKSKQQGDNRQRKYAVFGGRKGDGKKEQGKEKIELGGHPF